MRRLAGIGLALLAAGKPARADEPSARPSATPGEEAPRTAVGLVVGRERLRKGPQEKLRPAVTYLGLWAVHDLHPLLAVGVELSTAVRISFCNEGVPCDDSKLTRVGALAESKLVLVGDRIQALEAFGSLAPSLMYTSERLPENLYRLSDTAWGAGLTARLGPRVLMRWLTLAPYVEACVYTEATHLAYGYGLQVGLRFGGSE